MSEYHRQQFCVCPRWDYRGEVACLVLITLMTHSLGLVANMKGSWLANRASRANRGRSWLMLLAFCAHPDGKRSYVSRLLNVAETQTQNVSEHFEHRRMSAPGGNKTHFRGDVFLCCVVSDASVT